MRESSLFQKASNANRFPVNGRTTRIFSNIHVRILIGKVFYRVCKVLTNIFIKSFDSWISLLCCYENFIKLLSLRYMGLEKLNLWSWFIVISMWFPNDFPCHLKGEFHYFLFILLSVCLVHICVVVVVILFAMACKWMAEYNSVGLVVSLKIT